MGDGDRDEDKETGGPSSGEGDLTARLRTLEAKLADRQAEKAASTRRAAASDGQSMGRGLKLASDFVAGVLVGAGLGWLIDRWLGTSPWGLIVFLLLGFAAGVLNVLRSVGMVSEPESRLEGGESDRKE